MSLSVIAACGGGNKQQAKTTPGASAKADKADPPEEADVPASTNLAVSNDLAALCHIPAEQSITPRFGYNRDDLLPDDREVLTSIARCVNAGELKGRTLHLIGRADSRGTEEYNLALGSRRAGAVGTYLSKLGMRSSQLIETTRGSIDADGNDEAGWRHDRRVDIVLDNPKTASR
jgi:peptidoglycan-associated lipoprotein